MGKYIIFNNPQHLPNKQSARWHHLCLPRPLQSTGGELWAKRLKKQHL